MNRVFVILVPFKFDDGPNEEFLWVNDSYVSPLTSLQIPKDAFFWVFKDLDLRKHQGKIHSDTKFRVPFGNIVYKNQDHFCNLKM